MKLPLFDTNFKKAGDVTADATALLEKPNKTVLYETIKAILANQRQGTASTKNRANMSGTTAKCYRQKGTGRARHGAKKANIFVGGAQTFGPAPRDYTQRIPKKVKKLAVKSALTDRALESNVLIVEEFKLKDAKTKLAFDALEKMKALDSVIVTEEKNETLMRTVRNLPKVEIVKRKDLNAYTILRHEKVLFVKDAWENWQKSTKPEDKE